MLGKQVTYDRKPKAVAVDGGKTVVRLMLRMWVKESQELGVVK